MLTQPPHRTHSATKDTLLPLSRPVRGYDDRELWGIPLAKGTMVVADFQAANVSKKLWGEDAEEWKPERWLAPLPREVEEARMPGVYAHL